MTDIPFLKSNLNALIKQKALAIKIILFIILVSTLLCGRLDATEFKKVKHFFEGFSHLLQVTSDLGSNPGGFILACCFRM